LHQPQLRVITNIKGCDATLTMATKLKRFVVVYF